MRLFDPVLYEKVHLFIILAFSLYYFFFLQGIRADKLLRRSRSNYGIFLYALVFIIVVGFRPVHYVFGDTVNYAHTYSNYSQIAERITTSYDSLFYLFMWLCSQYMNVNWFFFIIEILYIVPIVIGCSRLLNNNADIGLLFCFTAFSFFTYGVNGLRNGVALSLVFLAITFLRGSLGNIIISIALSLLGIAIHASAALPVVCMLGAYFIKKPKWFFFFWFFSILVSLAAGNTVANLFANLGFDERLSDYILLETDESMFSRVGFRWDFLLYSSVPVFLGWYICIKKRVYDRTYLLLLGTYLLSNAFWIMVIRAAYSNRFAYLSWFLFPVVISYPLLKLRIWPKKQGQKFAIIMAGHCAFSYFMYFVL